jgi:hypothetical protein
MIEGNKMIVADSLLFLDDTVSSIYNVLNY